MMTMERERFSGCILGGYLGDVIGAPVESESAAYIGKTYRDLDHILERPWVEEILGQRWLVGRYTDDTTMTLSVLEWLLHDSPEDGKSLLARFAESYRPGRRYGGSAARLLEAYPENHENWRSLATLSFPQGSYGNGSAMRVAPVGLAFANDPGRLLSSAILSSLTTHAHPNAQVGAALQASAVALALKQTAPGDFLQHLRSTLEQLERLGLNVSPYRERLDWMAQGLRNQTSPKDISLQLGTGLEALESVPMAIYCFLSHSQDFEACLESAVFLGGDVDTLAAMAGNLCGAYLGLQALPRRWLARVREDEYPPGRVQKMAEALWEKFGR